MGGGLKRPCYHQGEIHKLATEHSLLTLRKGRTLEMKLKSLTKTGIHLIPNISGTKNNKYIL